MKRVPGPLSLLVTFSLLVSALPPAALAQAAAFSETAPSELRLSAEERAALGPELVVRYDDDYETALRGSLGAAGAAAVTRQYRGYLSEPREAPAPRASATASAAPRLPIAQAAHAAPALRGLSSAQGDPDSVFDGRSQAAAPQALPVAEAETLMPAFRPARSARPVPPAAQVVPAPASSPEGLVFFSLAGASIGLDRAATNREALNNSVIGFIAGACIGRRVDDLEDGNRYAVARLRVAVGAALIPALTMMGTPGRMRPQTPLEAAFSGLTLGTILDEALFPDGKK